MTTIEFHLFRIKFIRPHQSSLWHDERSPAGIFKAALNEKPSVGFSPYYIWHIGNIEEIDDCNGSFAIGNTTKRTVAKYDSKTGNFIEEHEELFEESPYTMCFFDSHIGFVAIAKKLKLAPTTKGIANKLKILLETSRAVSENAITIAIDPINDPDNFIQKLNSSYAVKQFTAKFTGPNPVDADEIFQKPMSVYCKATNADTGQVIVKGEDLDKETIEKVTKSTAATGNEASAIILEEDKRLQKTIHLKGNQIKKIYVEGNYDPETVLKDMRKEYKRIRS